MKKIVSLVLLTTVCVCGAGATGLAREAVTLAAPLDQVTIAPPAITHILPMGVRSGGAKYAVTGLFHAGYYRTGADGEDEWVKVKAFRVKWTEAEYSALFTDRERAAHDALTDELAEEAEAQLPVVLQRQTP